METFECHVLLPVVSGLHFKDLTAPPLQDGTGEGKVVGALVDLTLQDLCAEVLNLLP